MEAKALYTFGYEGIPIENFVARLKTVGVRTVLDVRQLPLSRKRGFSKNSLAAKLHCVGIIYAHLPALGCPRAIRDRYKADGDWASYTKAFGVHLTKQEEAITELARIARKST